MQKIILSAALVCGLAFGANAQAKKTTVKTKTTTEAAPAPVQTTTTTTQTSQSTNAGAAQETNSSGGFFSRSQESSNGGDIKAAGGDITLEANVNPFNGNQVSLSNSLNQIRLRYFLGNDMAVRLGGHLSFNTNIPAPDTKTRAIEFSIAPGIEKHFAGTNRLSPYVGAELLIGIRSAHSEFDGPGSSGVEVKGSFSAVDNTNRGFFLVGLGGVGGFDFYVAKHLYLGYELSLELSNRSYSEIEEITTDDAGEVRTKTSEGSSAFSFGPNVRNGIRVGFVF